MPHNLCYEFGPFQFDLGKRVLKRAGETVSLTPKATDILVRLVSRAGHLVEKDELLKEVWPDTFVEEANLVQHIFALRKALSDDRAGPKYIETVTRRGYRFIATVRVIEVDENQLANAPADGLAPELGDSVNHRPVIAVLPFTNVMNDPEVEYLVQGITDNIINNLSRISKLRVMSRSAVFRYSRKEIDPQQAGRDLGAQVVLVGKINSRPGQHVIDVELVDTSTGWQLWGEEFDSEKKDLLEIQDAITRRILASLKLTLSGDEEKQITARYTENAEAYQSYLEGRHHWRRYTRSGIERAILHFRHAIGLDANYALAYAGIIDCYLRLATNYLPPEDDVPTTDDDEGYQPEPSADESDPRVKLRFEWDWKGAEREIRRANELQTTYPTAPQWFAAYKTTQHLYEKNIPKLDQSKFNIKDFHNQPRVPQIVSLELTSSEEIQVYCTIGREQIDSGNYDAASKILRPWWIFGNWPKLNGLNQKSSADLLFTTGELAGFVASTQQIPRGQRHGEELLIGSITLFEHLGLRRRAAEGRIELALCYYRQGLFDTGRSILIHVLGELSNDDWELRSLALIRLASLERHAGRLRDALDRLIEATDMVKLSGPWATGRRNLELASTYKDLAIAEESLDLFNNAKQFYYKALHEFEAIGNHRYVAIVENNIGFLLLNVNAFQKSEYHLLRSNRLFEAFSDVVRGAQVSETLARLYVATERYDLAKDAIQKSVEILKQTDGEALLAEALTTNGLIESKLGNYTKAKSILQAGCSVAERCGDNEGAGRALLILLEELSHQLERAEKLQISEKLKGFFATTQQKSMQTRLKKCIENFGS